MGQDYTIHIASDAPYQADESALREAVWQALALTETPTPRALTVTLTSAERIHELNQRYAGIDSTTDVLSFPSEGEPYAVDPGDPPYLGDVLIAYPVAEQQAGEAGIPLLVELQTLAIHGALHLLGYDHDTPDRQAEMWALQSAALDATRAAKP